MLKRFTFLLFGLLFALSGIAQDFSYDGINYTVIDPVAKTVKTKDGGYNPDLQAGNNVSGDIIIPESVEYLGKAYTVVAIGEYSFIFCGELTGIKLPDSVTKIGVDAFRGCSNLTSIEIPSSVINIGSSAFSGCSNLTSVELPSSLTNIEAGLFEGCTGLVSVLMPSSVTKSGLLYASPSPRD